MKTEKLLGKMQGSPTPLSTHLFDTAFLLAHKSYISKWNAKPSDDHNTTNTNMLHEARSSLEPPFDPDIAETPTDGAENTMHSSDTLGAAAVRAQGQASCAKIDIVVEVLLLTIQQGSNVMSGCLCPCS